MTVKIHTAKNATWVNAAGDAVPFKFVPKSDKRKEELAGKLHATALKVEASIAALHTTMRAAFKEVEQLVKAEYELKNGKKKAVGEKGNITWFNFDRSIKIEANVNDIVKWDSALMTESLTLLNSYISSSMSDANVLIAGLVKSAFSNTKGMIDTAKVYQILRHEEQIKDKRFQKACELIKQASSIDRTKLYMRIWEKGEDGEYRNVNLNFSNI
jgi:hypothetical protein